MCDLWGKRFKIIESYMPIQSQKQRRFLYANLPKVAKAWEKETSRGELPVYKGDLSMSKKQKETKKHRVPKQTRKILSKHMARAWKEIRRK